MDLGECPAPNPLNLPGRDRAMKYPLDNPRKEATPVPFGQYYLRPLIGGTGCWKKIRFLTPNSLPARRPATRLKLPFHNRGKLSRRLEAFSRNPNT